MGGIIHPIYILFFIFNATYIHSVTTPETLLSPPQLPSHPLLSLGLSPFTDTPVVIASGDWVRIERDGYGWSRGEERSREDEWEDVEEEDVVKGMVESGKVKEENVFTQFKDMLTKDKKHTGKRRRPSTYVSSMVVASMGNPTNKSHVQVEVITNTTIRLRTDDLAYLKVVHGKQGIRVESCAWEAKEASVFVVERIRDGVVRIGWKDTQGSMWWFVYKRSNKDGKRLVSRSIFSAWRKRRKPSTPTFELALEKAVEADASQHWHIRVNGKMRHGYSESVVSVHFDLERAKTHTSERQVVTDLIFPNESNTTQQMQYAFQASLGLTQSIALMTLGTFETVNSVNLEFTPVVRILAGQGSTQFKFSLSRSKLNTETVQTQRQQTFTFSLAVPARRQVRASASAIFANADIPFTMIVVRVLRRWDGTRVSDDAYRYEVKGTLKEENFSEQRYHVGQEEPVDLSRDPSGFSTVSGVKVVATSPSTSSSPPSSPSLTPLGASSTNTTTNATSSLSGNTTASSLKETSSPPITIIDPPRTSIPPPSPPVLSPPVLSSSSSTPKLTMDASHKADLVRSLGRTRHDFLTSRGTFGPILTRTPHELNSFTK